MCKVLYIVSGQGDLTALKAGIYYSKINDIDISVISHDKKTSAQKICEDNNITITFISDVRANNIWADQMINYIKKSNPSLIILLYNRIIPQFVLSKISCPVINFHPALLPSFKGFLAIDNAIKYGVKITGVTAHIVDETIDGGKPIIQSIIPLTKYTKNYESLKPKLNEHYCIITYAILNWLKINYISSDLANKLLMDFEIKEDTISEFFPSLELEVYSDYPRSFNV